MAKNKSIGEASSSATSSSSSALITKIPSLEKKLLATRYDPNALLDLLKVARNQSPEVVHKAIWATYRVFVRYTSEGKIGGLSSNSRSGSRCSTLVGEEADEVRTGDVMEARQVKSWVRERLLDYVEILAGLLRDSEPSLRQSAVKLLFSLLPPLSASITEEPVLNTPYIRMVIRSLLSPSDSLRGATARQSSTSSTSSSKWTCDPSSQVDDEAGVLPDDVVQLVSDEYWAAYDDLRWAFFKETTYLLKSEEGCLSDSSNLLAQLMPLTNLPKLQEDLNTFFIPSLSEPPSKSDSVAKSSKKSKKKKGKPEAAMEALPEWMQTYESESSSDELEPGMKKRQRVSKLSVHASVHSIPSHQTVYTDLWETVLSVVPLDEQWTRKVLAGLHGSKGILGHMKPERRIRVADWLGSLVDQGGAKAMLAMNGLFLLMTKYNLDYPNFYQRLYALLDENVLHVKYRARFFRLLDTFLASPLLPAALIASFIKRLSRLALNAPPAGIIIVIPFNYNLFKRHPGCMKMIQRPDTPENESGQYTDPYNPDEKSPFASNAIDSSCWELVSLQDHYLASVSTMAKIFNEVFTKPEYNMEDFLDHGYSTLFDTEMKRVIKRPPALSMAVEGGEEIGELFPGVASKKEVTGQSDIVSSLWSF